MSDRIEPYVKPENLVGDAHALQSDFEKSFNDLAATLNSVSLRYPAAFPRFRHLMQNFAAAAQELR